MTERIVASCRWCREVETGYHLDSNHGGGHGIYWGHCLAQGLTRNHVTYAAHRLGVNIRDHKLGPHRHLEPKMREYAVNQLERDIERATVLWAHRDDTDWLAAARTLLDRERGRVGIPEHALVGATEEASLW